MEYGFFHPERGYWQAIGGDPDELLAGYPQGTIQVPLKPGADYEWQGGKWVYSPPPEPSPEELREAMPALNPGQIRLALLFIGITEDMVDAELVDDPAGLIEWKYRPSYRRLHPLVTGLAGHFGLSAEQVDALWLWAVEL